MKRSLVSVAAAMVLPAMLASAQGLTGPYAAARWDNGPIFQGTTQVLDAVTLVYDVDLGFGGGVSSRTAQFSAIAGETGPLTFLYDYRATHSTFNDRYELTAFATQADGSRQTVPLVAITGDGPGSVVQAGITTLNVVAGRSYGIIVGGGNFDFLSFLRGSVTLSEFRGVAGNRNIADWSSTGIAGGTTSVQPAIELAYGVDLGNPSLGVFPRNAEFTTFAIDSGSANFNWSYSRDHSSFFATAFLEFFADGDTPVTNVEINELASSRQITTDGSFVRGGYSLPVENGGRFGVRVGGGNFDSISFIVGSVTISNFTAQVTAPCPADFNNDGSVGDIFDLFDFLAALDAGCP